MKKICLLLLCALILALSACLGSPADTPPPETTAETTAEPVSLESVKALLSSYTLVRAEDSSPEELNAARLLRDSLSLKIATDWVGRNETVPQDQTEVLIGVTNRDASREALAVITQERENHALDYIIRCGGGKVVITGGSAVATESAAQYFMDSVVPYLSSTVLENYEYIYRKEYPSVVLNKIPITEYSITLEPDASVALRSVATVLQEQIMASTGFELPITQETAKNAIHIKHAQAERYTGTVELSGSTLTISGDNILSVTGAMRDFAALITQNADLQSGYKHVGKYDDTVDVTGIDSGIGNVLSSPSAYRPVPTEFEKSSAIDDLLYFPMPESSDKIFAKLEGGERILGESVMYDSPIHDQGWGNYGKMSLVTVEDSSPADPAFDRAFRMTVTKVPTYTWQLGYRFFPEFSDLYKDGDVMIARVWVRLISGGDFDTKQGAISFTLGERTHDKKYGGASLTAYFGTEWTPIYLAIATNHDFCEAGAYFGINPGLYEQTIEIGGFELINYGTKYQITDLPSPTGGGYAGCEEDAAWRKEALDKIEAVRRGEIKVIVKDADGNAVPDAEVSLTMREHEVNFATLVPSSTYGKDAKLRELIVENFNSVGSNLFHRGTIVEEEDPEYDTAEQLINWAYLNGVAQSVRGHALIWDTNSSNIDAYRGFLYDQNVLDAEVHRHFAWMADKFPMVTDWDVSNEDGSRLGSVLMTVKPLYGKEVLINWYKSAAELFPHSFRAITDGFGMNQKYKDYQRDFMAWADKNLDFNAIGQQGHISYGTTPENMIQVLNELSAYGKPIRITEFDTGSITDDQNYQANLVRDIMIAYFSCENVDTIMLWYFRDHNGNPSKRILYSYDNTLKPAGRVYQDLVYNKWWTRESGKTDSTGSYSAMGYYGEYTVSAVKDGKTVSVDVQCYKGNDNTVTVVLPR